LRPILPLGSGRLGELAYFLLRAFVMPLAIYYRFLLITPLSLVCPPLRKWALERCSSFVLNLRYRHEVTRGAPIFWWAALEFGCFLRAAALIVWVWPVGRRWSELR